MPNRGLVVIVRAVLAYNVLKTTEIWEGAFYMSDHKGTQGEGPVPLMQQLLDSPFLLLIIGVGMPTVIYIIWGIMEIVAIPVAP